MPPQFFVKFQYKEKIKKISVSEDQFKWDNICKILLDAFMIHPSQIRLTYNDPEGDKITACCDEDLIEAYKTSSKAQPLKFFVSKVHFIKEKSVLNKDEKCEKSRDNSTTSQVKSKVDISQEKRNDNSNINEEEDIVIESMEGKPLLEEKEPDLPQEPKICKVASAEIKYILEKLLQTKEAKRIIQEFKLKVDPSVAQPQSSLKFALESDHSVEDILNVFNKALNELNEDVQDELDHHVIMDEPENDLNKSLLSQKPLLEEEEEKYENVNKNCAEPEGERNLLNVSLKESIYGDSHLNMGGETKKEDFKAKSFVDSSFICKDLSSTYGVRLALRYENGKMKLMSIPAYEYSIIDSVETSSRNNEENNSLAGIKRIASEIVSAEPKKEISRSKTEGDHSDLYRILLAD